MFWTSHPACLTSSKEKRVGTNNSVQTHHVERDRQIIQAMLSFLFPTPHTLTPRFFFLFFRTPTSCTDFFCHQRLMSSSYLRDLLFHMEKNPEIKTKKDHSCWAGAPECVNQYLACPITASDGVPAEFTNEQQC